MSSLEITTYYASLNELAALYADHEISMQDFFNQRRMMYWMWHGE